jgi:GNAT superfamily N-acetyltransferase
MDSNEIKIIELTESNLSTYYLCLEDWSDVMKESGDHKETWYRKYRDKGLRVKLAQAGERICGMIQYMPAEQSWIEGKDIYFILCIWVHGYKEGIGNYQKRGIGRALLQAAEDDVRSMGKKGIAAWGLAVPVWMKASWFRKKGYLKADRNGIAVLLWKKFSDDAEKPSFIKTKKLPEKGNTKVRVHCFINGWCPAQNIIYERTKKASLTFGDKVEFITSDTSDRNMLTEWGISDAVYINKKSLRMGPPPSYESIRKKISRKIKR